MEVHNIILRATPCTFAIFKIGFSLGIQNLANSLCAILICLLCWSDMIKEATGTFMSYLIIDIIWRSDPIPKDILFHHVCCFALTYSGLFFTLKADKDIVPYCLRIISILLSMEFTSPFLHAARAFKERGKMREAAMALVILIITWIPIRLWYPLIATKMLWDLTFLYPHTSLLVALFTSIGLCTLQFVWFWRLCVVAHKAMV